MSVQATSDLVKFGLLGEYFPSSRKRNRPLYGRFGCMHLLPPQPYSEEFYGCIWLQPVLTTEDQSSFVKEALEENTAASYSCISSIYTCDT